MSENRLYYGDNLKILREYIADESVDLIYLDPPFNSDRNYNVLFRDESGADSDAQITAFEDTWHWGRTAQENHRNSRTLAWLVRGPQSRWRMDRLPIDERCILRPLTRSCLCVRCGRPSRDAFLVGRDRLLLIPPSPYPLRRLRGTSGLRM